MKELSIEEKAKRYDERLAKARKEYSIHEANNAIGIMDALERVFPELKESEDERIRKKIIATIHLYYGEPLEDEAKEMIDWLEKQCEREPVIGIDIPFGAKDSELQEVSYHIPEGFHAEIEGNKVIIKKGEQKPVVDDKDAEKASEEYRNFRMSCGIKDPVMLNEIEEAYYEGAIRKQKPADKVEPKFHEGDWIINPQGTLRHILNVDKGGYQTDGGWLSHDTYEKTFHLWTINDAKDGDVLYYKGRDIEYIVMNKGVNEYGNIDSYFRYNSIDGFGVDIPSVFSTRHVITPATKEQRDLLFQKMHEAGYEWDAEKKEIKKIEQKLQRMVSAEAKEAMYNKPAWSEEDEMFVHGLIRGLSAKRDIHGHTTFSSDCIDITETINWLKSLKDRVQPKQEWSEEDEGMRLYAIKYLETFDAKGIHRNKALPVIDWLKSLRPQNNWKPSDEQIDALEDAIADAVSSIQKNMLNSLYQDIKKLREE